MPPRLTEAKRKAILDDIKAGRKSRNQIARDHNVGVGTVTKLAQDHNLTGAFDRSATKAATAAATADNKSRRARLASLALDDANAMRLKAISAETGRDARDFATAYGIFVDKSLLLERVDSDGGTDSARGMIGALAAGLRAAYDQLPPDDQP